MTKSLPGTGALVFAVLASSPALGQLCPDATNNFWKNDILPDNPLSLLTVAVIPGLCEGEAAGSIFNLGGAVSQRLTQVSVGAGSALGGDAFAANIEIYEGTVTFAAGVATLGPKVFDLSDVTGNEVQLSTTAMNTVDFSSFNVVVSGEFVVVVRVTFNPTGTCAGGYSANLFTDNASCSAGPNLIDVSGIGFIDPAVYDFLAGFTLCDLSAYTGNWAIRACTEDAVKAATAVPRNGSGVNPNGFASITTPALGSNWVSTIDLGLTGSNFSFVKFGVGGPTQFPISFGELLCAPPLLSGGDLGLGAHVIAVPNDASLAGLILCTQGVGITTPGPVIQLYNAIDLCIGS